MTHIRSACSRNIFLVFALTTFALLTSDIRSQDNANARSVGMSFSTVTSSAGLDAYGINPANYDFHKQLTLKKQTKVQSKLKKNKSTFELSILQLGGGYGSDNSFDFYQNYTDYLIENYNDILNFFTDVNAVTNFKANILPDEESNVNFDFEFKWLSLNYSNPNAGAFNITISDRVSLNSVVNSKENFLSYDTSSNANFSYNINNFRLEQKESAAWWVRKYSAGYAKQLNFPKGSVIKSISIGLSGALVHGFGSITTSSLTMQGNSWGLMPAIDGRTHVDSAVGSSQHLIQTASTDLFRGYNDGKRTQFSFFPKPAGTGYSFDFGMAMQISDYIRIAASVIELGKITWDYNTFVSNDNNSFAYYDFYADENDPTYNALLADLRGTNTNDSNITFETDMPTKYRAGISFSPNEMVLIEFNWLNEKNNLPGKPVKNLYSLGGEVKVVPVLPLRAGFSLGGPGDFNISLGAGLRLLNFHFDLGLYGVNQLVTGKRFLAALSTKLVF